MISLLLLAPVFLAPVEEGPAVMSLDGLAWHVIGAGESRDFTAPGPGRVVALVRRLDPQNGPDEIEGLLVQGGKTVWSAKLARERGSQLGNRVAGRAKRGAPDNNFQGGTITVSCSGAEHSGMIIQLEWITDPGSGTMQPSLAAVPPKPALAAVAPAPVAEAPAPAAEQVAAAAPTEPQPAAAAEDTAPETPAPVAAASEAEPMAALVAPSAPAGEAPALVAPGAPVAETPALVAPSDAPATDEDRSEDKEDEAPVLAAEDEKPEDKPEPAVVTSKSPIATVDTGLSLRGVTGGLVQGNVALRVGADLRRRFIPGADLGLELGLSFRSASGNALLPHAGMTTAAAGTTVRPVQLSAWSLPIMARYKRSIAAEGLVAALMVGPSFGGATIAHGNANSSEMLAGLAAKARFEKANGVAVAGRSLHFGLELGLEALWSNSMSSSRGFIGLDVGLPWSL